MAILAFQQPDKVIMIESDDFHGKFEFRPLEPGYGMTIGNSLRRILLSSLEGFAITSVRIEGVEHEFATIPGVMEDMTEIILSLKQLCFKRQIDDEESELCGEEFFTELQDAGRKEHNDYVGELFPNENPRCLGQVSEEEAEMMGLDTY